VEQRLTLESPVEARVDDVDLLSSDLQTHIANLATLDLHQIVVDVHIPTVQEQLLDLGRGKENIK